MNEKKDALALADHIAAVETRLTAETTVLRLAVRALIQTSAHPEIAAQTFEVLCEQHLSMLLASPARDARYDALQRATDELTALLRDARAQRQAPGS